MMMARTI